MDGVCGTCNLRDREGAESAAQTVFARRLFRNSPKFFSHLQYWLLQKSE